MKSLFWLLAVFAAAVALVIVGRLDAGYAVVVFPPYRIEASLLFVAITALLAFILLYVAARLLGHAVGLPATVGAFRARRRRDRAHGALAAALQTYYEGRYARAEKHATVAFEIGPVPGVAALLAARAAHQMREFERRDRWLARADAAGDKLQMARLVSRAELALEERDFAGAREALRRLEDRGAKQIATAHMLLRAERGTGGWDEVLRLADQLGKHDAISPAVADEYKVQAMVELLARAADDAGAFERRWRAIPARAQLQPRLAAAGARHAIAHGRAALAREIVEKAIAAEWSPQLASLYGELPAQMDPAARTAEARTRIERAERWLLARERDPELLATLGRLCAQAELWGKAKAFLEASLSFEPTRTAHLELARLSERLGENEDAQRHYRRAAELN